MYLLFVLYVLFCCACIPIFFGNQIWGAAAVERLFKAVDNGDAEATMEILTHNPHINLNSLATPRPPPHTPFSDVNALDGARNTPLITGCISGKEDEVRELLCRGRGERRLVAAVLGNHWCQCQNREAASGAPCHRREHGCRVYTPLGMALCWRNAEIALMLERHGGTVNEEMREEYLELCQTLHAEVSSASVELLNEENILLTAQNKSLRGQVEH
ncbi:hypothetical protein Pelo_17812 [Pelomyxa schiedti]|nr:hypothetical protein Pelo_17812 [Pelomyxa schiedti]